MATRISPQNALKLSAWLATHEPALFREVLRTATRLQRSPLGRFGLFGDDSAMAEVVVTADAPAPDVPPVDTSSFITPTADVASIDIPADVTQSISDAVAAPPAVDSSISDASSSSGGFWSSLGSGLGSAAGTIAKVAGALVSPQTISAVGNAAASYFNAQARSTSAQAQQAAVQAQLSRVAQGAAPAPITYARDPVTGALTPVYASNTGYRPLTPQLVNRIATPQGSIAGLPTMWVLGGGIAAAILFTLLLARR